ncbi:MAG: alpha/beta hydrolase [Deltaproteobacteria bacterium]|nr:alpha/beta hydrolase [Deltaproteobacteria bacterium]
MEFKALALVIHGLNNTSHSMEPIAKLLERMGVRSERLTLPGHFEKSALIDETKDSKNQKACLDKYKVTREEWQTSFSNKLMELEALAKKENKPLFIVGYSLGALVCFDYFLSVEDKPLINIAGFIFFAPALFIRPKVKFLKLITSVFKVKLPSLTPKAYRSHDGLSADYYQAFFESLSGMQKRLRNENFKNHWLFSTPGLIFIDSKDELVSYKKLRQFIDNFKIDSWKVHRINKSQKSYHHLIIDPSCLGETTLLEVQEQMAIFLDK